VAFKGFLDGTITARTGALLAPYADGPGDGGPLAFSNAELARLVVRANGAGFPVALHAVGDRAVRAALDAFEAARKSSPTPMTNRIEHLDVVDPADLPRFATLGVAASVQPTFSFFASPSTNFFVQRLGASRMGRLFPWRDLAASGALILFSTDYPVGGLDEDPVRTIFSATQRKYVNGEAFPWSQSVDPELALAAMTWNPARAVGRGADLGKIEPGYVADLTVLDADPRSTVALSRAANRVRAVFVQGALRAGAL
jgi:predicted amidohydrolase YtcJ